MSFISHELETLKIKMASKRKRDGDIHTYFIRQSSGRQYSNYIFVLLFVELLNLVFCNKLLSGITFYFQLKIKIIIVKMQ